RPKNGDTSMLKDQLVGMWKMVGAEFQWPDGAPADLYGDAPTGVIIYGPLGDMAVQIMRAGPPRFASGDFPAGTPDELGAAVAGYMAYFGRYDLDEAARTVTHHIRGSLFPNWIGQDLTRVVEIDGTRLILRTAAPMPTAGRMTTGVLIWERS